MKLNRKRALIMLPAAGLLLAFGALANGETNDALLRRYPYDPACAWGRISNGKGLIVRCLTESEAQAMRAVNPAPIPSASSAGSTATGSGSPTTTTQPATSADPVTGPSGDTGGSVVSPPGASDERLEVTVGPVTADSGQLGIGKLGAARERYAKCVSDNGGLKEASGEVQVRFLLRQRGRAEGVSVAKRSALSAEAARCISEVVDRRYVGVPDAAIVGATVTIKFVKASK